MAPIAWLAWSADAFARARAEGKPVLLFLAPTWCRFSAEMERTSYADDRVAARVADVLQRVYDAFASGRHVQGRRQSSSPAPAAPASTADLIAQVTESFD